MDSAAKVYGWVYRSQGSVSEEELVRDILWSVHGFVCDGFEVNELAGPGKVLWDCGCLLLRPRAANQNRTWDLLQG